MLNSLDQSSLLATWSMTVSASCEGLRPVSIDVLASSAKVLTRLESEWPPLGRLDAGWMQVSEGDGGGGFAVGRMADMHSAGLRLADSFARLFGLKNPLSVCCPHAGGVKSSRADFERFMGIFRG